LSVLPLAPKKSKKPKYTYIIKFQSTERYTLNKYLIETEKDINLMRDKKLNLIDKKSIILLIFYYLRVFLGDFIHAKN